MLDGPPVRAGDAGSAPATPGPMADAVLAAAFQEHAAAMIVVDADAQAVAAANAAAAALYGYPVAEMPGLPLSRLDAPTAERPLEQGVPGAGAPSWRELVADPAADPAVLPQRTADGRVRLVEVHLSALSTREPPFALAILREVTAPLSDELLALVSDAVFDFMAVPAGRIDEAVDRALARAGSLFDVDRSYVFRIDDDAATMSNTHEWVAAGISAELENLQDIPTDTTPWWLSQLRARRAINLFSLDDLPPEAAVERAILEPQGIQSLLILPLVRRDRLDGFVGFDHVRARRRWRREEVEVLRLIAGVIAQSLDRHLVQQRLERADSFFTHSQEAIALLAADRAVMEVNPAFTRITGFTADDVVGRWPDLLRDSRYGNDFYRAIWRAVEVRGVWRGDLWASRKEDAPFLMRLTLSAVLGGGGAVESYVAAFDDVTAQTEQELRLERLASVDGLTGLPNRRGFAELLGRHVDGRGDSAAAAAVILLDVDRFTRVNDSYGHAAGDFLLTTVAARLSAVTTRQGAEIGATLSRFGGNEFVLLVEACGGQEEAEAVAESMQRAIAPPVRLPGGHEVFVSACVGIALVAGARPGVEQTLQNADAALHVAKKAGPGSIRTYGGALVQASRARLSMETRLRQAWDRRELWLAYQPQLDVTTGRVVGAEALLRWTAPSGRAIPPSQFIPLAEEIGLIHQIGGWVVQQACAQGRAWIDAGLHPITIAVNLSPAQFLDDRLSDEMTQNLAATGFPSDRLELELTESTMIESGPGTHARFAALSQLGVSLAIDDFGTGYSSFAALKRLPLDKLKIDRSFVRDIVEDSDDLAITAAIIRMGHSLGLRVLAEGVETQDQLRLVRDLGCDYFQGFLVSPAVDPDRFAQLMATIEPDRSDPVAHRASGDGSP